MIYLVSGIDTGIGKTVATAALARRFGETGRPCVTAKLVQTGAQGLSPDIAEHRRLLGQELLPEDRNGDSCSQVFAYPASPHLAARLEGCRVDIPAILAALARLEARYGTVFCEGAGGLMVPLDGPITILDLAAEQAWPVYLVTSGRLGSINATLLSLAALRRAGSALAGLVFNEYDAGDAMIAEDSLALFSQAAVPAPCWRLSRAGRLGIPSLDQVPSLD